MASPWKLPDNLDKSKKGKEANRSNSETPGAWVYFMSKLDKHITAPLSNLGKKKK